VDREPLPLTSVRVVADARHAWKTVLMKTTSGDIRQRRPSVQRSLSLMQMRDGGGVEHAIRHKHRHQ